MWPRPRKDCVRAAETIEATGWWTVVRPGLRRDMRKVSSKPMMEMSSGTDSPMEVIVRIAPSACRSDPVMIGCNSALDQSGRMGCRGLVCIEGLLDDGSMVADQLAHDLCEASALRRAGTMWVRPPRRAIRGVTELV